MTEAKWLTREEAAVVCGRHVDTLRRDQRRNKFPNARMRRDGVVEIPVADLVAAGRLDPLAADTPLAEIATKSRVERELMEVRQQLALSEFAHRATERQLERAERDVEFLRALVRQSKVA